MSLDIWFTTKDIDGNEIEIYDANYTHNVTNMWKEAGCYDALYMSEGKKVKDIVGDIKRAIKDMESNPEKYKQMNAPNGWGAYKNALPWLKKLYNNIKDNPSAEISIWK